MADAPPPSLSDREMEILRLVTTGATNQEIASRLVISPYTVKTHLQNIFAKLGVATRTEATMVAVRQGWVTVPLSQAQGGPGAARDQAPAPGEATAEQPAPAAASERAPLAISPVPERWPSVSPIQRVLVVVALALVLVVALLPQVAARKANGKEPGAIGGVFPQPTAVPGSATGQWSTRAQMPTPRNGLAASVWEGQVYAIGGVSNDGVTGKVEVYDPETDAWTARRPKPVPAGFVSAAAIGDRIFVPGGVGTGQEILSTLEVYDPKQDSWASMAPLPAPLAAYGMASWNGRLYLFGGIDQEGYVGSVLSYDPASDRWEQHRPMRAARGLLAAATLDDRIYVVGGYDDESEYNTCEVYDPAADTWADCQPMSGRRGGLALVAVRNNLYAVGGGLDGYLALNERYDPRLDLWTRVETPIPEQWRGLAAAFVDPFLYAIGGWSGENLAVNEAYQALFYQMIILP